MLNNKKLDLTAKDIEMIEAALHTQKKILSVQSEAGGSGARQRLTDLTQLIGRIGKAQRADGHPTSSSSSWAQAALHYLTCANNDCRASQ